MGLIRKRKKPRRTTVFGECSVCKRVAPIRFRKVIKEGLPRLAMFCAKHDPGPPAKTQK